MNWFRSLKIGARLSLGFGLVMLIFVSSLGLAMYNLMSVRNALNEVIQEGNEMALANQVDTLVNQVFMHVSFILNDNDLTAQQSYQKELEAARADYKGRMAELKSTSSDESEGLQLLNEIDKSLSDTRQYNDQVVSLAMNGKVTEGLAVFKSMSLPANQKIDETITAYLDLRKQSQAKYSAAADAQQKNTIIMLIIAGFSGLAAAGFVTIATTRGITQPVNKASGLMSEISTGNLTMTVQASELDRKDELGEMSRAMSRLVENMRGSLGQIQSSVHMLASASTELSSISEEMTAGAGESSTKANAVAAAAEELNASTLSVAAGVEQATTNLTSVATATEEMTATISEIASNSEKARSTTIEAARQADNVSVVMKELGQAAQEIGKVTETINSISAQTNLLALNATIEAARAGAAGKGFAVVANEIKELAQQTAAATGEIKGRIASIQGSTAGAVADIDRIVRVIKDVNDIVNAIATAIEEQSVVTRDIAGNIAQASSGVKDANRRIAQTATVSGDIAHDIVAVSQNAHQMASASQQVQSSASELSHLAENLRGMLAQYRVGAAGDLK